MINLQTVEFVSKLIKYERYTIISQCHVSIMDQYILRQFSLDV